MCRHPILSLSSPLRSKRSMMGKLFGRLRLQHGRLTGPQEISTRSLSVAPSFYCERRVRRGEPPIFSLTRPALRSLVALKPQTPPTKQEGDCQPELRKLVPIFWSLGGGVAPKKVSTAPFLRVPENFPSAYLYASPWEKCLDISNSRLS